jgi:aminoglycoside-2''-adenylyltransferase
VSAVELDVSKWDAWRPEDVVQMLAGVDAPWYVAGGWALDLFLGAERREHRDLEIAVPGERFDEVATALSGFELFVVVAGGEGIPLPDGRERLGDTHQTWVLDTAADRWRLDVFREPSAGGTWICRRDRSLRLPYSRLIQHTADGIPYALPEVILLFKAKHADEEKNERDFRDTAPRVGGERRRWLHDALEHIDPTHAWLARLNGSGA